MHSMLFSCHEAHLDPVTGAGLLVLPRRDDDLDDPLDAGRSLHWSEFEAVGATLAPLGWYPLDGSDDDGSLGPWLTAGVRPDGREVIALASDASLVERPRTTVGELLDADAALRELAGLPVVIP